MRLIIQPDANQMAIWWAANYIAAKIKKSKPTAEKPFKLGLPTGSFSIETCSSDCFVKVVISLLSM